MGDLQIQGGLLGSAAVVAACVGGWAWELGNCEPANAGRAVTGSGGGRTYVLGVVPFFLATPFFARATFRTEIIKGRVWGFEQKQGIGLGLNTSVNTRMTILRLRCGGLLVYNPIAPTKECRNLVRELEEELGELVQLIVLPTTLYEHKQFLKPFSKAFPQARVLVSPGQYTWPINLGSRNAGCAKAELLSDQLQLPDEIECAVLDLPPIGLSQIVRFSEAALFHPELKVLMVCDAVISVGKKPVVPISRRDLEEWADDRNTAITGLRLLGLFGVRERWNDLRAARSLKQQDPAERGAEKCAMSLGWQRMAMTSLYFGQADVLRPSKSFEQLSSRLVVPPVLGTLVYGPGKTDEVAAVVEKWSGKVAEWKFSTVIPSHFDVVSATSRDWKSAFEVWTQESPSWTYPKDDIKCLLQGGNSCRVASPLVGRPFVLALPRQTKGRKKADMVGVQVREALGQHLRESVLSEWTDEERRRGGSDEEGVALGCYKRLLLTDLRRTAKPEGIGAVNIQTQQRGFLEGTRIIQINEAFNCAAPAKQRFDPKAWSERTRCLKMHCTDGRQDFVAIEYHHVAALPSEVPAGLKVLVKDAPIRRGALLLSPGCVHVLGGEVRPLQEANQKKVRQWNEVVSGQLGIKKEQHIDSIKKLLGRVTVTALGTDAIGDSPPAPVVAAETATTSRVLPPRELGSQSRHRGRTDGSQGPSPLIPQRKRRLSPTGVGTQQTVETANDSVTPMSSSTPSQMLGEGNTGPSLSGPPQVPQHMESLSDPRGASPLASWRSQGVSASGLEPSPRRSSFQLPVWAEDAANEMAERCTNDVEIRESQDLSPANPGFVASQAEADSDSHKRVDVDLVSDSEDSIFLEDDMDVEEGAVVVPESGQLPGVGTLLCRLANLEKSLQKGSGRVTVMGTINSLVSFSVHDGVLVTIEDGSDVTEVAICERLFQRLFGKRPKELKHASKAEREDLQKRLGEHLRSWEGTMGIERAPDGRITVVDMNRADAVSLSLELLGDLGF
ncbi:RecQ-mediated genome instability protein [Chloropicon primus]|nr:RecQ-mediated genome instability protein [Chloropicon primus]